MNNVAMRIGSAAICGAVLCSASTMYAQKGDFSAYDCPVITAGAADAITIDDMPADYQNAAEWIWSNRIEREQSTARWNTLFDQIIAGKGTINYVVRWQSYKTITYEQRQHLEKVASDSINAWNAYLAGYEDWPYAHIDVNVVGWAVIDASCLLDLHEDEIVYTDTTYYDAQYDTSNGYETIPDKLPMAPSELSRFDHFSDTTYQYPGGLDKRFDMYLWATQGFPAIGGCGGDWGQRLSDDAYLNMLDGSGIHVLEHEIGHGFGITDFYGGEGEMDGFPPGGFPGGGTSIMMAGSSAVITDFDGWLLRYMWTKIKDESGRFDIEEPQPTEPPTEEVTQASTEASTKEPTESPTQDGQISDISFTETITGNGDGYVTFEKSGTFLYSGDYYGGDESRNFDHYEVGDRIEISFRFNESSREIVSIANLTLVSNIRDEGPTGDVNGDGTFSLADVVMMQKWLLRTGSIVDVRAGDLCNDGVINVLDLCLMKRKLSGLKA